MGASTTAWMCYLCRIYTYIRHVHTLQSPKGQSVILKYLWCCGSLIKAHGNPYKGSKEDTKDALLLDIYNYLYKAMYTPLYIHAGYS